MSFKISGVVRFMTDPQSKPLGNTSCVTFLGSTRDGKDKEGNYKNTTLEIIAWGKLGDFVQSNFSKGSHAFVSGTMEIQEWTKDGVKNRKPSITIRDIEFLPATSSSYTSQEDSSDPDVEVPF